jgi:REP element-mobilizing transposase RayT
MPWKGIREKPHRLNPKLYIGQVRCSFAIQTIGRLHYFNDADKFLAHEQMLFEALAAWQCEAHIYMFMPDHVHLILEGKEGHSDLRRCVNGYKQRAGYAFKRTEPVISWQKDFYDHIIRNDADYRRQMNYHLMNPVRAGLTESWKNYPYWGSTVYSKNALLMGVKF